MKKSSLVMILSLVGMVGCHSGKQVKPAITLTDSSITTSGTIEHFSSGVHNEPRTGLEFCDDFQRIADDWNHSHPNDGVGYGCDNIHPAATNPISPGNYAVILPDKPAKKPKAKKRYAMGDGDNYREFEVHEQPDLPTPDKAAVPVAMTGDGPLECIAGYKLENHACVKIEQPNLAATNKAAPPVAMTDDPEGIAPQKWTFNANRPPIWSVTEDRATGEIRILDPKHEMTCYYGAVSAWDTSSGLTVTCVKSVEKAK